MVIDQCLDLSCALGQLRNCNCATDLLWAVGAMRHLQDAIQATTAASELSALGGDASAASADPDAPENPADEIARTKALARAFVRAISSAGFSGASGSAEAAEASPPSALSSDAAVVA